MRIDEFLDLLATDPAVEAQFDRAPELTMATHGVSDQDALLIMTGSLKDIRAKILSNKNLAGAKVFLIKMR